MPPKTGGWYNVATMLMRLGPLQIVMAVITALVAKRQGRQWAGWAAAALFIPILPLVLLAFLPAPKLPGHRNVAAPVAGPVPVCNRCGRAAAAAESKFCSNCGEALS